MKRMAEALFLRSQISVQRRLAGQHRTQSIAKLMQSKEMYERAMRLNLSSHWVSVQYLSLVTVLHSGGKIEKGFDVGEWEASRMASEIDLASSNVNDRAWAHCSLAELYLLRAWVLRNQEDPAQAMAKARNHLLQAQSDPNVDLFVAYSTRRQLARYVRWWGTLGGRKIAMTALADQAQVLLKVLS